MIYQLTDSLVDINIILALLQLETEWVGRASLIGVLAWVECYAHAGFLREIGSVTQYVCNKVKGSVLNDLSVISEATLIIPNAILG